MHAIDTYKAVTRLETTGMSRQTAEAVVEIFDTVANAAVTDLATKADLGAVAANVQHLDDRVEDLGSTVQHLNERVQHLDDRVQDLGNTVQHLSERVQHLDDRVEGLGNTVQHLSDRVQHLNDRVVVLEQTMATKSDLAEVRSDLAEVKTDIIRWNVGLILGVAAVMIAAVKLI